VRATSASGYTLGEGGRSRGPRPAVPSPGSRLEQHEPGCWRADFIAYTPSRNTGQSRHEALRVRPCDVTDEQRWLSAYRGFPGSCIGRVPGTTGRTAPAAGNAGRGRESSPRLGRASGGVRNILAGARSWGSGGTLRRAERRTTEDGARLGPGGAAATTAARGPLAIRPATCSVGGSSRRRSNL